MVAHKDREQVHAETIPTWRQWPADHHRATEQWDAFPPSARRAILGWIALARTAPTRAKRINETAERASRGERANQ